MRMVQNNRRDLKQSRQQNAEGTEQPQTPLLSPAEMHRRAEAEEEEEEEEEKPHRLTPTPHFYS